MTRMQEMSLDYHFTVEQEVGSSTYAFFGFNGTTTATPSLLRLGPFIYFIHHIMKIKGQVEINGVILIIKLY